ncbi:hypothetical protein ONR75_08035 [Rhodopseudomonas sp. P2A-2r]|uniref:hypothetical protein n=1 Tax=Rhodopseudomonas sp. P2A-2r TaxID=2991972 RepID=UPI002234C20D|nr:hypothetical protein [Rhodopseudomonas sp. P2A-2r]UZE50602.1 hypothetical protein ONR75_08035 [Rhodopseudomonas sp. P2A-2r]
MHQRFAAAFAGLFLIAALAVASEVAAQTVPSTALPPVEIEARNAARRSLVGRGREREAITGPRAGGADACHGG